MKIKKGDCLRYTGPYASSDAPGYPDGVAIGFRTGRGKKLVIVELVGETDTYADWPVDEVEKV